MRPISFDMMIQNRLNGFVGDYTTNAVRSIKAMSGQGEDVRRSIDDECGYPDIMAVDVETYKDFYRKFAISNRVVSIMPQQCWLNTPSVFEDEDPEKITDFEKQLELLTAGLGGMSWQKQEENSSLWQYIHRADRLSGIGHFGVILIGVNDGQELRNPVKGVIEEGSMPSEVKEDGDSGQRVFLNTGAKPYKLQYTEVVTNKNNENDPRLKDVIYFKVFDESDVYVTEFEGNVQSPRFGQPVRYNITFNSDSSRGGINLPQATVEVHWTRVVHVTDDADNDENFVPPRQRAVWNNILDLRKVYGGDAEAYWKNVDGLISLETHPQLGGDVEIDDDSLQDMMEETMNGMQKWIRLAGLHANRMAPQLTDPSKHVEIQLDAICIQLGCPKRIFLGSERGELASSQDSEHWNTTLQSRRENVITPRHIVPLLNRLISIGCLPEPEQGFSVVWPDIDSLSPERQADVAAKITEALAKYVQGDVESIMELTEYLIKVIGLSDEDAKSIAQKAVARISVDDDIDPQQVADETFTPQVDSEPEG